LIVRLGGGPIFGGSAAVSNTVVGELIAAG
jgi:hypothetical protein